ncbi:MAG TPA: metallophosphoesterase family protein [Candidatus Dormibacteraeota bacterium]|nr:metallophosphoesterase family protein [Candidatus Dormibacteraeota bacterium]
MRVAVVSDSHGELAALRCVLHDLKQQSVDHVVFAGDMAQGGPDPAETVDLLRSRGWPAVRGNSDDFLLRVAKNDPDAAWPQRLIERGRESNGLLGAERLEYLAGLPLQVRIGELLVVHATPWDNEEVVLPDAPEEKAREMVTRGDARVVAYGHIHSPYQRRVGDCALASVGAIAASNDSDPRPAYSIIDLSSQRIAVEVHRAECPDVNRKPGSWPVRSDPNHVWEIRSED